MKFVKERLGIALCALLLPAAGLTAELGLPAPELAIKQWIKGGPIQLAKGRGTNVYVVEFWATWCPPCRTSIPHLTDLQKKFRDKGVVFVGISDEDAGKVRPFVSKLGGQMDYAVAIDADNKTSAAYMQAFGVDGIPHAFVVDRSGALVWHGHPMGELEGVLSEVVAGRFDVEQAKRVEKTLQAQQEYFRLVSAPGKSERAPGLGNQVLTNFARMPGALDEFAWRILTDQGIKQRDFDLALRAARQAFDITQGKAPSILDTYARALFDTGKREEAVERQKQAIALTKEEGPRLEYESRLNRYQRLIREGGK